MTKHDSADKNRVGNEAIGNKRSFHKCPEMLTQHWPHKPHPARHHGAYVCVCVCVCFHACVCVCASVQKGTLWCESSTSDWISWTLAEHSRENREKLNALRYPKNWLVNTCQRQTGWQWDCCLNFIIKSPSIVKAIQAAWAHPFVMHTHACE